MMYRLHIWIQSAHFPSEIVMGLKDAGFPKEVKPETQLSSHYRTTIELTWNDACLGQYPEFATFHKNLPLLMAEWKTTMDKKWVFSAMLGKNDDDLESYFVHGFPHYTILEEVSIHNGL